MQSDTNDNNFSQRLRERRLLMNLTQAEVAARLHLESTAMISRWERGETLPSLENALKLSVLYKTLVNELFYELFKEIQSELFPEEKEIIKHTDNGPN
jgi:transcriptional regulator with XRE-family HTH domain